MTIDIKLNDKEKQTSPTDIKRNRRKRKSQVKKIQKDRRKNKVPKPKNPNKKKWPKYLIIILALLFLGEGLYYVWGIYQKAQNIGLDITPGSLINIPKDPELKKDSTGTYTNFMIVGIDTRENSNLLNTDTIILASYNYETNDISMLSLPRDFHVEIGETNWFARINTVYSNGEKSAEGNGLAELQKTVEILTKQEIQYYSMVDFKAFIEIIDSIGGITVNVENSFTDYMYPSGILYKTVKFEAGPQEMDGETALEYARSRHSMQNGEGSDYARAARQQKVIIAVKDKILSTETLLNPKAITSLISSVANNIKISEFTIGDIEAGIKVAKDFQEKKGELYSFVLDPSIGNNKLVEVKTLESGAYAIGPVLGLGQYQNIHTFMNLLTQDPLLYTEEAKIRVYNTGLGYQETYQKTLELKEQYPYLNIIFSGNLYHDKEGIVVFTKEESAKTHTVEIFADYLETKTTTKPEYILNNLNGEDVTILLGKDILLVEEPINGI